MDNCSFVSQCTRIGEDDGTKGVVRLAQAKIQSPEVQFRAALGGNGWRWRRLFRTVDGVLKVGGTRLTVGCWKTGV